MRPSGAHFRIIGGNPGIIWGSFWDNFGSIKFEFRVERSNFRPNVNSQKNGSMEIFGNKSKIMIIMMISESMQARGEQIGATGNSVNVF